MLELTGMVTKVSNNEYIKPVWDVIAANKYLSAATIFVVFFILAKLILWVSEKFFLRLAKKTKSDLDDLLIKMTEKPISVLLLFIGARLAIIPLEIEGIPGEILAKFINSLIAISLIYIAVLVVKIIADHWGDMFSKRSKSSGFIHFFRETILYENF